MENKINALKLALAGGILVGACFFLITLLALIGVPGFEPFAWNLESMYESYGYSVSFIGMFVGAVWGFVEGFVHLGLLAVIYNWLVKKS